MNKFGFVSNFKYEKSVLNVLLGAGNTTLMPYFNLFLPGNGAKPYYLICNCSALFL